MLVVPLVAQLVHQLAAVDQSAADRSVVADRSQLVAVVDWLQSVVAAVSQSVAVVSQSVAVVSQSVAMAYVFWLVVY